MKLGSYPPVALVGARQWFEILACECRWVHGYVVPGWLRKIELYAFPVIGKLTATETKFQGGGKN